MSVTHSSRAEPGLTPELTSAYVRLLEERTGLRLSDRQAQGLDHAVRQLQARTGYSGPLDLYNALATEAGRDLVDSLAAEVTVGETHFFRIGPQIQALRRTILPAIVDRRSADRRLGIWSAGCSTGEEAYTVAILLQEALPAHEEWHIKLLATDINYHALDAARQAIYGEWSFRDTPDLMRQRYFTATEKRWRLVDPVRRMVRFAQLNLAADPFPSPGLHGPDLDLILCRNVTIYFSPAATQRLYRRFAEALVPGGWLVLGPSDPVPDQPFTLDAVHLPGVVLWRRPTAPVAPAAPTRPVRVHDSRRPSGTPRIAPERATWRMLSPRARPVPVNPSPAIKQVPIGEASRGAHFTVTRDHVQHLVQARPLEVEGHLLLGMLLLDEGAIEAAVDSLRRARFLDDDNALAHFGLGQAYVRQGEKTRARAAFTRARRILAATPDDEAIAGGGDMSARELRYAIDAQLVSLGQVSMS